MTRSVRCSTTLQLLTTKAPFIDPDSAEVESTTAKKKSPKKKPAPKASDLKLSKTKGMTKVFVLDTSVLLHDHNSLQNFEDNRVAIPITVLEELDTFKVGNDTKNFEARECIRILDRLSKDQSLQDWFPLENESDGFLRIIMCDDQHESGLNAAAVFDKKTNDHKILTTHIHNQLVII